MAVQPGTEARQVICSCLKQNSNVLLLYICNQLVQLLRIVSVWNPITVENRQINVSKGSSIVPPKSLHLIIQNLVCLLTAQWGGWGKDGVGDVGVWVGVGVGAFPYLTLPYVLSVQVRWNGGGLLFIVLHIIFGQI